MQFLSLYTAAAPAAGPPSEEQMAKMGQLMDEMTRAGVLKATGGIMSRQTGMKVTLKKGAFTVADGPVAESTLMPASGFALLEANSREELVNHIERFLSVAGDGTSEVIQIMTMPPEGAAQIQSRNSR